MSDGLGTALAERPRVQRSAKFEASFLPRVSDIARDAWTSLFPGEAEGWDYYTACEACPPAEFSFAAIAVQRGGELVAAAPVFRLNYRLDTPLQGKWRPLGEWLHKRLPKLVNMPVMGLGSPLADRCHLGFASQLSSGERTQAMHALLQCLDLRAACEGVAVLAVKDLYDCDLEGPDRALRDAKFTRVSSLPVAVLDLPYASQDAYLNSLSGSTRKDIRRKLKQAADIRVEFRHSIEGLEARIADLYDQTRLQSGLDYGDLERLSPTYFRDVMNHLGERAVLMLYWLGDDLIAFNLCFVEQDRLIDKFIGMQYPLARDYNLYVLSWMTNVRYCLERGIRHLQTGQTAYASKLRFGSRLDKTWVYFKHRGRVLNSVFRTIGPLLAFDKMDPDLAALNGKKTARQKSN